MALPPPNAGVIPLFRRVDRAQFSLPRSQSVHFERVNAMSVSPKKFFHKSICFCRADARHVPERVVKHDEHARITIQCFEQLAQLSRHLASEYIPQARASTKQPELTPGCEFPGESRLARRERSTRRIWELLRSHNFVAVTFQ